MRFLTDSKIYSVAVLAGCLLVGPQASKAQSNIYVGEATIAKVDALVLTATVVDTGMLPSVGGSLSAQLANVHLPGVLNLALLDATTVGANNQTSSQASTTGLNLTAAGISI